MGWDGPPSSNTPHGSALSFYLFLEVPDGRVPPPLSASPSSPTRHPLSVFSRTHAPHTRSTKRLGRRTRQRRPRRSNRHRRRHGRSNRDGPELPLAACSTTASRDPLGFFFSSTFPTAALSQHAAPSTETNAITLPQYAPSCTPCTPSAIFRTSPIFHAGPAFRTSPAFHTGPAFCTSPRFGHYRTFFVDSSFDTFAHLSSSESAQDHECARCIEKHHIVATH